jgi:hypothetical protein
VRRFQRQIVKVSAEAVDRFRSPPPGLVVLSYHRVGRREPIENDLPTNLFLTQMDFLAESKPPVTLESGLRRVRAGNPSSTGAGVTVTFDDGTVDFVDTALPLLVERNVPAVLYVATAFVEEQREFPDAGRPLTWAGLREAQSTGLVTIGSHTHDHALLDRLDAKAAEAQIDRSVGLIQDRLGVDPRHFAYPKFLLGSREAQAIVRAQFSSAALGGTRPNRFAESDPFRLARSPVLASDGMHWFKAKVQGGLALEDSLRRMVNRWRYSGLTS